MSLKKSLTVVFFITIITFMAPLQANTNFECPVGKSSALVFSNGMFNDLEDAQDTMKYLRATTKNDHVMYTLAYNFNEQVLIQLYEVYSQHLSSNTRLFWKYLSEYKGPKWFKKTLNKLVIKYDKANYVNDSSLKKHIELYQNLLNKLDLDIVIVAHSQGNFYANMAYEYLTKNHTLDLPIKIVSVATPAPVYYGLDYVTLKSDSLIRSIPNALAANLTNDKEGAFDHKFIKHYMSGNPSGSKIISLINDSTIEVSSSRYYFTPGYLHRSFEKMNKWAGNLKKNNDKKLSKIQCLALELFDKNGAWFGEDCSERNLDKKKYFEIAKDCFENNWQHNNMRWYICGLYGLDPFLMNPWSSSFSGRIRDSREFSECKWSANTIGDEMSLELIRKAIDFMENPE